MDFHDSILTLGFSNELSAMLLQVSSPWEQSHTPLAPPSSRGRSH